MNIIAFDIETIPDDVSTLSDIQRDILKTKLEKCYERDEDTPKSEVRNKFMATNGMYGKIVCIGISELGRSGEVQNKAFCGEEDELLQNFWNALRGFRGVFVSYNGLDFDVPFILMRSIKHRIAATNTDFTNTRRFSQYPHYDVMHWAANWDRFKIVGLRALADFMGLPSPKEGEIEASNVYQAYQDGRIDEIAEYCLKDTEVTLKTFLRLKEYTSRK